MSISRVPIPKLLLSAVLINVLVATYTLFSFVTMWQQLPPQAQSFVLQNPFSLIREGSALLLLLIAPLALLRVSAARWLWLAALLFWGVFTLPGEMFATLRVYEGPGAARIWTFFARDLLLFSLSLWAIFSARTAAYAAGPRQQNGRASSTRSSNTPISGSN